MSLQYYAASDVHQDIIDRKVYEIFITYYENSIRKLENDVRDLEYDDLSDRVYKFINECKEKIESLHVTLSNIKHKEDTEVFPYKYKFSLDNIDDSLLLRCVAGIEHDSMKRMLSKFKTFNVRVYLKNTSIDVDRSPHPTTRTNAYRQPKELETNLLTDIICTSDDVYVKSSYIATLIGDECLKTVNEHYEYTYLDIVMLYNANIPFVIYPNGDVYYSVTRYYTKSHYYFNLDDVDYKVIRFTLKED